MNLPVFKTGVSRVNPGSGRFDSDTLPPILGSLAPPPQRTKTGFAGDPGCAQDFGARLPLGGLAASLTPRKRLKFDSHTLPP